MDHFIEVDADVFVELQARAVPFLDTPNSVLRRVLGIDGDEFESAAVMKKEEVLPPAAQRMQPNGAPKTPVKKKHTKSGRAPVGSLLPESEYEIPLLAALAERGGSAPSREVIDAVGTKLKAKLTDLDKQPLKSGGIRWESRVQFVRLRLIEQGLMVKESGRGIWAISDEGRKRLTAEGGNGNG